MSFNIFFGDITKLKVDAIVNPTSPSLQMGSGISREIFKAAGANKLQAECAAFAPLNICEAVITEGFKLPSQYIIHTAVPAYFGGWRNNERLLRDFYYNSLRLAEQEGCDSIAFPLASSGNFGNRKLKALYIAVSEINRLLHVNMNIFLVISDREAYTLPISLMKKAENFFKESFIIKSMIKYRNRIMRFPSKLSSSGKSRNKIQTQKKIAEEKGVDGFTETHDIFASYFDDKQKGKLDYKEKSDWADEQESIKSDEQSDESDTIDELDYYDKLDWVDEQESIKSDEQSGESDTYVLWPPPYTQSVIKYSRIPRFEYADDTSVWESEWPYNQLGESFSSALFRLINSKGRKYSEIYKKANIDRKLFSKIRTHYDYVASKRTVLAFAIALELSLDETNELLEKSGFILSKSFVSDIIVESFISKKRYNIYEINKTLYVYDQMLL